MGPFTQPKFELTAFNCPHCGAFAKQQWSYMGYIVGYYNSLPNLRHCLCAHCEQYTLWHNQLMLFPSLGGAAMPHSDLPDDIKSDYEEARSILNHSPRGAAALLRLAIQKLCTYLGEKGKNINEDIGNLVKKGLPIKVQQSLDIVRVIGNNAVHPGQLDLTDDVNTASKLFMLINIIVDVMITQPQEIDSLFNSLPENQLKGIKQRDAQQ